ncbi:HIT domain-containing protein [Alteromonas facilis]|uniref:HIT domain-containing protein n=1 Tax=Alteromonas facilis TaxID=2048004 RepID=UPI000C2859EC|nr:HIT domain-containing protein [Alteromonas facilis]
MNNQFGLDGRLQADTYVVGSLPLCELLLSKDANYPWFILVPRVAGATEMIDLTAEQQHQFNIESNALSHYLRETFKADKLNIAALGNVVSQLHVHHIARFTTDVAWPKPIWNAVAAKPYSDNELKLTLSTVFNYMKKKELL